MIAHSPSLSEPRRPHRPPLRRPPRRWLLLLVTVLLLAPAAAPAGGSPETSGIQPDWSKGTMGFLDLLTKGDYDQAAAYFGDKVMAALPPAELGKLWAAIQGQAGAFQGFGEPKELFLNGRHVVQVPVRFQFQSATLHIAWDPDGSIAGFRVLPPEAPPEGTTPSGGDSESPPASGEEAGGVPGAAAVQGIVPDYVDRARIEESEVTVGSEPWALPGTLTLPKPGSETGSMPGGKSPVPAVVLVHGSGPNDRDETLGPNRPFRDLAWGLATRGIAVLRYEKRTRVHGARMDPRTVTVEEEVLADAEAAVDLLRKRPEIDGNRIFVLGHSLGATLAPLIAEKRPDLAGILILAGVGRPLLDVLAEQIQYVESLSPDSASAAPLARMRAQVVAMKDPSTPDSVMVLGMTARYLRDLDRRSVLAAAARLKLPVLVLQGGRDYQATEADLRLWKKALASDPKAAFKLYPDLNHLFYKGVGKATPQEYVKPGPVDPEVVRDIAAWILAR